MKRATTIIAVLLFITLRTVSAQGWAPTGPQGANVIGITSTPTKLVVGANNSYNPGGVWLSPINGGNWVNVAKNLPNKKVSAVGALGETLFVSNGNHYNIADGGTYRSEDGGLTWEKVRSLGLNSYDIFNCFFSMGDTIYAGSELSGVFRSYDNGTTWENSTAGLLSRTVLCFTSIGDTIYIGTQKGVYYSIDGAITWTAKNNGISTTGWDGRILSMTTIGDTIYAATYKKGVFKSTFRGDSWTTVNNGISDLFMNAIYAKGSSVYASNSQGILKMNNGGASWTTANQGIPAIKTFCFYNQGSRLIAGGQAGLFETTNNGANWIEANTGLAGHTIGNQFNSHEIIFNAGQYMFLGTSEGRIYRSADQGTTWQFAGNGLKANEFISSFFYINQTLYACYSSSGFYSSTDWGDTWEPVTTFPSFSGPIQTLVKNNRIWACWGHINYSDDFGATWNIEENIFGEVLGICEKMDDLFAISKGFGEPQSSVHRSNHGTEPFIYMGGITNVTIDRIFALGDTLFVAGQNGGIYQSIDDGVTWTTAGLADQIIRNYAVSGNHLFIRTRSQIYIRNNANGSWVQINSNLPPVLDDYDWYNSGLHATANKLYAGISSLSLYEADMANFSIPSQPSPIVGATAPCVGSTVTYSVSNVPGISYTWQIPYGWVLTSGGSTNSITVTVGSLPGVVMVTPTTLIGSGPVQFLAVIPAPLINASVSILASPGTIVHPNTLVTYTATPVNGGNTPTYQWYVNDIADLIYGHSPSYTYTPLDGDQVKCELSSSVLCITVAVVTSNTILMQVSLTPFPTAFAVTGSGSYCQGSAGLPVGVSNSGIGTTYTLIKNGVAQVPTVAGTGAAISFGNQLFGTYTVSGINVNGTTLMTGSAIITVNPIVAASVTITSDANNVCAGTSVIFTASPVSGGTTPTYQWYKNSVAVVTGNTYTYIPVNGDVVYAVMTSNALCTTGSPATSNAITMVVNSPVAAGVTITGNQNNVCAGTSVTFIVASVGGGTTPIYQWYKNTVAVVTGNTYTYIPVNGDVVYAVMTSNALCTTGSPATSNAITMVVNSPVAAGVAITGNQNNVCAGTSVTFTAAPVGGGTVPTYQWFKNNVASATGNTYTYITENGDVVYAVMTSNALCTTGSPATSNTITMVVNPSITTGVTITESQNNVCAGTSVTFMATPVGGGTTPSYQWFVNSILVSSSSSYVYVPVNGDEVYAVMTSNALCTTGSPATSNSIAMVVGTAPVAAGTIYGQAVLCAGITQVVYSVLTISGADSYLWTVPIGSSIVAGTGTNVIMVDFSLSATSGAVTVHGLNECGNGVVSPTFNVTVNAVPATPVISRVGSTLYSNAPTGNQWYKDGVFINGATASDLEVTENGIYTCIVTTNGCSSEPSNSLVIINVGIANPTAGQFVIFPVPSNGLFTAVLASPSAEIFTIRVYNNLGSVVYEKKDVLVNGATKQTIDMRPVPSGIYMVTFTSGTSQVVRKMMINRD